MKKKICLFLSSLFAVAAATAAIPLALQTENAKAAGDIEWNTEDKYETAKVFDRMPNTFEATIQLDPSVKNEGTIIGNIDYNVNCINFGVTAQGYPFVVYNSPDTVVGDYAQNNSYYVFKVDVRSDEARHVAVTRDEKVKKLYCYVDGVLKSTVDADFQEFLTTETVMVGGDRRYGNLYYFRGVIEDVALYADMRTESEINADMGGVETKDKDLIAAYELSGKEGSKTIADLSGNGYDLQEGFIWSDGDHDPKDYAYSLAIVGDTQAVNQMYPEHMETIYDWIVDNVDSKKIAHVMGLGDITETDNYQEWSRAKKAIAKLDDVVPYSIVRGNHDSIDKFNSNFGRSSPYADQYFDRTDGTYVNTAHEFSAGKLDYLVLALDYNPSTTVLNWASELIEEHPYHNVIISLHIYLDPQKRHVEQNGGAKFWNNFVSKHKNITMVFCGHELNDYISPVFSVGDHGNKVMEMLVNPQGLDLAGAAGMVAMLYFSEDGKTVSTTYYSTVKEQYYKDNNLVTFEVNTIPRRGASSTPSKPNTPTDENKPNDADKKESGCGSVIGAANFALLPAAIGIALCKKRKQD